MKAKVKATRSKRKLGEKWRERRREKREVWREREARNWWRRWKERKKETDLDDGSRGRNEWRLISLKTRALKNQARMI